MTKEELLGEVEDILRTMPTLATLRTNQPESFDWTGRLLAFVQAWDNTKSLYSRPAVQQLAAFNHDEGAGAYRTILTLLHEARHDLRMKTLGPVSVAVGQGRVFDYFDELRRLIESAKLDLFFVDPYLDAEFVSRFLPQVQKGVPIRLLTGDKRLATLLPAVDQFVTQSGCGVSVRFTKGLHDRHVFIDRNACYQSGASFKDGPKNAPTA